MSSNRIQTLASLRTLSDNKWQRLRFFSKLCFIISTNKNYFYNKPRPLQAWYFLEENYANFIMKMYPWNRSIVLFQTSRKFEYDNLWSDYAEFCFRSYQVSLYLFRSSVRHLHVLINHQMMNMNLSSCGLSPVDHYPHIRSVFSDSFDEFIPITTRC